MWSSIERLIITLGLICLVEHIHCTNIKIWNKAVSLAGEIHQQQHEMSSNQVMFRLYLIRDLLARNTAKTIIRKLTNDDKMILMPALALLRLSNVNYEQCIQSDDKKTTLSTNPHQGNYIELANYVKSSYRSPKILALSEKYFQAQLFVCRNSLLVNFGKWKKLLAGHAVKFAEQLADHFENLNEHQFDALDSDTKSLRLVKFFVSFYGLEVLKRYSVNNSISTSSNHMKKFAKDCRAYLLDPYKTLMMTYNQSGPNLPILDRHYGHIINAYDYCKKLHLRMATNDLETMFRYYVSMSTQDLNPQANLGVNVSAKRALEEAMMQANPTEKRHKAINNLVIGEAYQTAQHEQWQATDFQLITQAAIDDEHAGFTDPSNE